MVGTPVNVRRMEMGVGEFNMSHFRIRFVILYRECAVSYPF